MREHYVDNRDKDMVIAMQSHQITALSKRVRELNEEKKSRELVIDEQARLINELRADIEGIQRIQLTSMLECSVAQIEGKKS